MSVTTDRELVEQAHSLIARCREGHLNRLVIELSRALQTDLSLTRLAITRNGAEEVAAARESRRQLEWLVSMATETLREVADAPFEAKDLEVHAFGCTFTPKQASGIARRLVAVAFNAQQQVDYAAALTRKALNPQPAVSIQ